MILEPRCAERPSVFSREEDVAVSRIDVQLHADDLRMASPHGFGTHARPADNLGDES